jgi:hypothetical protein
LLSAWRKNPSAKCTNQSERWVYQPGVLGAGTPAGNHDGDGKVSQVPEEPL